MKFGPVGVADLEGAILAHSLKLDGKTFKKGRRLSADDRAVLEGAGIEQVIAAVLEPGDVHEDAAAARLVEAVRGAGLRASAPFTGRCNLFAEREGLLVLDEARLRAFNFVSEELTIATLPAFTPVVPRQMVATVKVIPFSSVGTNVAACEAIAAEAGTMLSVAAYKSRRIALIQTQLPATKTSVLDKTTRVLAERLERLGSAIALERRCGHDSAAVSEAVAASLDAKVDMVLIAGASAIVDRRDVVPAGIEQAGGVVAHFGMPVDPGNLLLLAHHRAEGREVPVIGLPGCARSPKMSGFDFVLRRLVADVPVTPNDIMAMGAFGLLKEHASRPSPRSGAMRSGKTQDSLSRSKEAGGEEDGMEADGAHLVDPGEQEMAPAREARIAAVVLAAGRSRRMGVVNKLLEQVDDAPMVAHAVEAAVASAASPVLVITGHERDRVVAALAGFDVQFVHNPDFKDGLSTSMNRGLTALPAECEGVVVCLSDMPGVEANHIDRLVAAFDPVEGRSICVPTFNGKRGNPVLFSSRFFPEMMDVRGDVGARHLIGDYEEEVCEVPMTDAAVLTDIDSPDALQSFRERDGAD